MEKPTVLLVDDDDVFVDAVSAVLEQEFNIRTACNGTEAFAQVAGDKPDVIVLDVMMDHLSEGFDVARKLKKDPATRSIPVVMLTGVDSVYNTRMEVSEAYFVHDAYLEKPVEPRELLSVIQELLAKAS